LWASLFSNGSFFKTKAFCRGDFVCLPFFYNFAFQGPYAHRHELQPNHLHSREELEAFSDKLANYTMPSQAE
jgi:hypothetical protein